MAYRQIQILLFPRMVIINARLQFLEQFEQQPLESSSHHQVRDNSEQLSQQRFNTFCREVFNSVVFLLELSVLIDTFVAYSGRSSSPLSISIFIILCIPIYSHGINKETTREEGENSKQAIKLSIRTEGSRRNNTELKSHCTRSFTFVGLTALCYYSPDDESL